MKGLKELVEESLGEFAPPKPPPVDISGEAIRVLSHKMRQWSGWPDATLKFGVPQVSKYGQTDHNKREFIVNADALVLNPNRVLHTVTPFRLKQEAVMTGVMLHEAGHARFSNWLPRTAEEIKAMVHGDNGLHLGEPVTAQTIKFARLLEEPRIEGHVARSAPDIGADNMAWTMRAATAALIPFTELSTDPDQQIMDIINSYVLRAGKQIGVAQWTDHDLPSWVGEFNKFVHSCISSHMQAENGQTPDKADTSAAKVMSWLTFMILCVDHTGTYMVDIAREVLDLLYPNGSDAAPQEGCQMGAGEAPESDTEGGSEGEEQSGGGEGEAGADEGSGGEGSEVSGNPSDGDDEPSEADKADAAKIEAALQAIEGEAKAAAVKEADETSEKMEQGGMAGGKGPGTTDERGFRVPGKDERAVKKGAEGFLRSLIEPTESSKVLLSDQPSSNVDAALYAAWRADGGHRQPQFFRRTKRTVEPSPPVDIAILVDISSSMDQLQGPSAILSWALSAACTDLANFAGRGTQVRSTLIHWGDSVRVIQPVGQRIPGLKEYRCDQGTSVMGEALAEVENQMPGFFDLSPVPSNRLLVHFTDWLLYGDVKKATEYTGRALAAGVNILSVVPAGYRPRSSKIDQVVGGHTIRRGRSELIKYTPGMEVSMWNAAAALLSTGGNQIGSF